MSLLAAFDLALLIGLTLRLTRLVVRDDLGQWFIWTPALAWVQRAEPNDLATGEGDLSPRANRRWRLVSGLDCPFCVGFWLGALATGSLYLAGGPGSDESWIEVWRWVAGIFTLNYIAAHIGSRLDAEPEE